MGGLISQQGKCLCDEGQSGNIYKQEDSHGEVEDEKRSSFELFARIDVSISESSGQKEVNWCNDERDNCDVEVARM